jgi:hypothetical protein
MEHASLVLTTDIHNSSIVFRFANRKRWDTIETEPENSQEGNQETAMNDNREQSKRRRRGG